MKLTNGYTEELKRRQADPAFFNALEEGTPLKGVRVNPLKVTKERFTEICPFSLSPVEWEPNGFYVEEEKAGGDPYHFAGLYYCQEPSAMFPAPLLKAEEGERVLDLCAAPGGKSTQLAASVTKGTLYVNEYVTPRAKGLLENLERLGVKNAAAFSADPKRLAAEFEGYFDKILVDAPCSGEGMFRKEGGVYKDWSRGYVLTCAARQREILESAAKMLSGGGAMVYSTCTFSPEENEGQIAAFLSDHPEFCLTFQTTLYPHEVKGEGQFAAVLHKKEGARADKKPFQAKRNRAAENAYESFCKGFFTGEPPKGEITCLADGRMYLLPQGLCLTSLRLLRAGIEIGEWNGKIFRPSHMLSHCVKKEDVRFFSLPRSESARYLRGEVVEGDVADGWLVVGVDDFPLGLGKAAGGVIKNHFPKGLRMISRG